MPKSPREPVTVAHSPGRLTAGFIKALANLLKAGAYEQVAVESLGESMKIYRAWLRAGRRKGARGLARKLADEVKQSKAHARLMAEVELRKTDAKTWLLHGPGRESPRQPGWAAAGKPPAASISTGPSLEAILAALLAALAPFPDARLAAAQALDELKASPGVQGPHPPGEMLKA
jgi:hypothetical protein